MDRQPAVAGQFYPGQEQQLRDMVAGFMPQTQNRRALGIVSPHAGYLYSGAIAGETFAQIHIPDRVLILGPNHHGVGSGAAVDAAGAWVTPLGRTPIDGELAQTLVENCSLLSADESAHRFEHSLEVQLPFVQYLNPRARIVPICFSRFPLASLIQLGEELGDTLKKHADDILVVASSDMTHYESGEQAREKDTAAIERILDLDPEGLFQVVAQRHITMCGMIPTVVMLAACRRLGAKQASLVRYGNSGEVTGDQREVVGYAGLLVE